MPPVIVIAVETAVHIDGAILLRPVMTGEQTIDHRVARIDHDARELTAATGAIQETADHRLKGIRIIGRYES
jgi:hypothetical protein